MTDTGLSAPFAAKQWLRMSGFTLLRKKKNACINVLFAGKKPSFTRENANVKSVGMEYRFYMPMTGTGVLKKNVGIAALFINFIKT